MSVDYTYDITLINSSGAAIVITYGTAHNWWLSHPEAINSQGFIQVTGKGSASGTFKISVKGEEIKVDFSYVPGKTPTLTSEKLTPGPYVAQKTNGPYAQDMTAKCTIQVVDPQTN